jgi:hypothetical protein
VCPHAWRRSDFTKMIRQTHRQAAAASHLTLRLGVFSGSDEDLEATCFFFFLGLLELEGASTRSDGSLASSSSSRLRPFFLPPRLPELVLRTNAFRAKHLRTRLRRTACWWSRAPREAPRHQKSTTCALRASSYADKDQTGMATRKAPPNPPLRIAVSRR